MALVLQLEVFNYMHVFIFLGINCNRILRAGLNKF